MKSTQLFSLQPLNSFAVNAVAPIIYFPENNNDLDELVNKLTPPFYILGEGSNTLFVEDVSPTIVKPEFFGITIEESLDDFIVTAACAENWHQFVCFCIEQGIYGLENLALIPGSVGAAPVQNIGAYGVELSDFIKEVSWFDFNKNTTTQLKKSDCQFNYRNSIFKQELNGKGLITAVTFCFPKNWQAKLSYQGLNELAPSSTAKIIMEKVIAIRQSKLPDPKKIANAGSFFKNPIITEQHYQQLTKAYPDMPNYPQDDGMIKIAAGWLIEQSGLKGFKNGNVGVHDKQALVLVNFYSSSGDEIKRLAQMVRETVYDKFSIALEAEVRMVSTEGEVGLGAMN